MKTGHFRGHLCSLAMWAAILLTAGGCVDMKRSRPERTYYLLEPVAVSESDILPPAPEIGLPLVQLRPVVVSPRFMNREWVYRLDEHVYESDYYHAFFLHPAVMIFELASERFFNASYARFISLPYRRPHADYQLELLVHQLYGDFRKPEAPAAVVMLQARLLRDEQSATRLVMNRRYRQRIELKDRSPDALIAGWNQAVNAIFKDLDYDLRTVFVPPDADAGNAGP